LHIHTANCKGNQTQINSDNNFFVFYTDATQRSPMYVEDKGSQGFPTSAYYCIPLQPPYTSTSPNHLLIVVNITKILINSGLTDWRRK